MKMTLDDIAKYKINQITYAVSLCEEIPLIEIDKDDEWIFDHHSKAVYDNGYMKKYWTKKIPSLSSSDFDLVMGLLSARLSIKPFVIHEIIKSTNTGELFYCNDADEWMPESFLFHTYGRAFREKTRIKNMIKAWVDSQ